MIFFQLPEKNNFFTFIPSWGGFSKMSVQLTWLDHNPFAKEVQISWVELTPIIHLCSLVHYISRFYIYFYIYCMCYLLGSEHGTSFRYHISWIPKDLSNCMYIFNMEIFRRPKSCSSLFRKLVKKYYYFPKLNFKGQFFFSLLLFLALCAKFKT